MNRFKSNSIFRSEKTRLPHGIMKHLLEQQSTIVGVTQPSLCTECAVELSGLIRESSGGMPFGGIYCPHTRTLAQIALDAGRVVRVTLAGPIEPNEADELIEMTFGGAVEKSQAIN